MSIVYTVDNMKSFTEAHKERNRLKNERLSTILDMYAKGDSLAEIGRKFGITRQAVSIYIKRKLKSEQP